jgi:FMN phosphatase YigB (HAD superfamily)
MEKKGYPTEQAIKMYASGEYRTFEELFGVDSDTAMALATEYQESKYMGFLSPFKDALLAINTLKHKYNFIGVTAVLNSPITHELRMQNLEFWYPGAFTELFCVGLNQSKFNVLSKFDPTIFIDDSPSHILEAQNAGHTAIRLKIDARVDVTASLVANNWAELSNLIQMLKPV